jgi:hypothetical protein
VAHLNPADSVADSQTCRPEGAAPPPRLVPSCVPSAAAAASEGEA